MLESLSWSNGTHAFKFGGEFRGGANDEIRDRGSSGSLTFTPLITSNLGAANTGNALAILPARRGERRQRPDLGSDPHRAPPTAAFYAQDDWRMTSRLTLNYGLRWEAELPRREVDNKMNSFDPLAINPVSGTPGRRDVCRRQRHARARVRDRLEQLRPARRVRVPAHGVRPTRCCAAARESSTARPSATRSAIRRRSASPRPPASSCRRRRRRARSGCATAFRPTRGRL